MKKTPHYMNDKICLNVLAGSLKNAQDIYKAANGHVLIGLLSKNYPSVQEAVTDMKKYAQSLHNAVSVGLGAGDPYQWKMVAEIAEELQPQHVNQVFTGVGYTRALLKQDETIINGLISPCGQVGMVKISTGPLSSKAESAIVPIETAIDMLKDMGCSSVKFFPMRGLETLEEYRAVCQACAKKDFMLEPTGGIDLHNFEDICTIAFQAGVKKIIPHVYTSIIDQQTGQTRIEDIVKLREIMERL